MTAGSSVPLLSIAMPCYQQVAFVEQAVRSVFADAAVAGSVELIVQDPGSTDGSRDVLVGLQKEFGAQRMVLCLEPDDGQSDAVNRALSRAHGAVHGWLNSDDRLRPGALSLVLDRLRTAAQSEQPAWLYGQAGMIDGEGRPVTSWIARYKAWRGRTFSAPRLLTENFIPQMGVFWTRRCGGRPGRCGSRSTSTWTTTCGFASRRWPRRPSCVRRWPTSACTPTPRDRCRPGRSWRPRLQTAREHAPSHGWRGRLAVAAHRVLGWRTRACYALLKPRAQST